MEMTNSQLSHTFLKGFWISVDGPNGAGKTIVSNHLANAVKNSVLIPEFSPGPVGHLLHDEVRKNPWVFSSSIMGQSLLFLSDFFSLYDELIMPSLNLGKVIISDRGFINKYVWQLIVLSKIYDSEKVRHFLDSLFSMIPPPDLTLYLTCDEHILITRLLERDGIDYSKDSKILDLRKANQESLSLLNTSGMKYEQIHNDGSADLNYILQKVEIALSTKLHN